MTQKKILIADDEPNIVVSLEYLLQREGFEVRVARDGLQAIAAIEQETPDLLLDALLRDLRGALHHRTLDRFPARAVAGRELHHAACAPPADNPQERRRP